MLVSTEWLAAHLKGPGLVVLHVGGSEDYAAGHIPGARRLSLADISVTGSDGLRLELPPLEVLQAALGRVGVTNESRVIIYAVNESVQSATRVWFTFDYAGLGNRAALLDGGLPRWKAEGRPLSNEIPAVVPTEPRLTAGSGLIVSADWIRDHLKDPNVRLIDTRTIEFYTGANPGQMPRSGRIPGALSLPYNSLLDDQLKLLSTSEIRAKFPSAKELVAYCHIGQQATLVYFAARLLGENVRLYDGSFQDWSRKSELPVETSVNK